MKEPCVCTAASKRNGVLDNFDEAIRRESQLKKWRRAWKVRLIESMNPEWVNLFNPANGEIRDGPADAARQSRR